MPGFAKARQVFPNVKLITDAGSGEEFLRFHRDMMREFKWLLIYSTPPTLAFSPWARLPGWLESKFGQQTGKLPADYVTGMYAQIDLLIQTGTADDLGNFTEATDVAPERYNNVHNYSHGLIASTRTRAAAPPIRGWWMHAWMTSARHRLGRS